MVPYFASVLLMRKQVNNALNREQIVSLVVTVVIQIYVIRYKYYHHPLENDFSIGDHKVLSSISVF